MIYRTIQYIIAPVLFLLSYSALGILMDWVEVYVLNHWDSKFGQSGAFYINLYLIGFMVVLACCGYLAGRIMAWAFWRDLSLSRIHMIAPLAGAISLGSWWGLARVDLPQEVGQIILWPYVIAGPVMWTIALSWAAEKYSKEQSEINDAA
jgi:hypothetical protein